MNKIIVNKLEGSFVFYKYPCKQVILSRWIKFNKVEYSSSYFVSSLSECYFPIFQHMYLDLLQLDYSEGWETSSNFLVGWALSFLTWGKIEKVEKKKVPNKSTESYNWER